MDRFASPRVPPSGLGYCRAAVMVALAQPTPILGIIRV